jgi:hypothetical protein
MWHETVPICVGTGQISEAMPVTFARIVAIFAPIV